MSQPTFIAKSYTYGRTGQLHLANNSLTTPLLFPVVCFVTGYTAKGGGLWKYVLQADTANGLMRRNVPLLSQVLHFLDFSSTPNQVVTEWRRAGVRNRYNTEVSPDLNYSAPLFFDSGGFKLLWSNNVDLSSYGLSIVNGNGPKTILDLQKDFGADIVATLDYPLPPTLGSVEAQSRMRKSRNNAVKAAIYLQENPDYKPFLYVAAHGQDGNSMGRYVELVFERFKDRGVMSSPFGLAVGSLVPLRGSHNTATIVEILLGLIGKIPDDARPLTPIHAFGVTGNLVPILTYLGVDSFDSSTYIQEARSLKYIDPKTRTSRRIFDLKEWDCPCRVCREVTLTDLQEALSSDIRNKPLPNGHYKSKYYGDIALHNLEMDFQILNETRRAIEADSLQDYLIKHVETYKKLSHLLDIISVNDPALRRRLNRTSVTVPSTNKKYNGQKTLSLEYSAKSFNILSNGYKPPQSKRILLIVPCSGGKPYSTSRSHRMISKKLFDSLGEAASQIHKVTLSGLYGPVPEEFENENAVLNYDFRLEITNKPQISLIVNRVADYLERHRSEYDACFAYATSRAYRTVLEIAARQTEHLQVIPSSLNSRRMLEFFRAENIQELVEQCSSALKDQ